MLEVMQKYTKYAMIPYKLNRCVDYCNIRDEWSFIRAWNNCIVDIEDLINGNVSNSLELAERVQGIGNRIRNNISDFMMCASIIEEEMIPLICKVITGIEINLPNCNNYELQKSKSGLFTIYSKKNNKLLHSMNNPMVEALRLADYLYKSEAENILICGAGLGYTAYQIWEKSYKSAHIYVFEKNRDILKIAEDYGVLDWIDKENITIICESDEGKLFDLLYALPIDFDKAICWVSDYFIDDIVDDSIMEAINSFSNNIITRERFRIMDNANIRCNKANTIGDISLLRDKMTSVSKEFIIVAAGPSLDYNLEYIKNNQGKKKIVAVESALKALLKNGITPDYVAVLDPTELIMKHIVGIEDMTSDIELIAYEKAYWKYVKSFRGDKYRITQSSENDIQDIHVYAADCTTVSSLAINIALYLGAECIDLVGLDLSYPNHKLYAENVSNADKYSTDVSIRSVDGSQVASSTTFIQFKNEIENIISKSQAKFRNLSQNGAYIQGTLMDKWWEKKPVDFENYLDLLGSDISLEWSEKYFLLWQVISYYLKNNSASESTVETIFWNKIGGIYDSISSHFLNQLDVISSNSAINDKYVVLLTSFYSNEPDEISDRIRNDAYNLKVNYGFEILIVNTGEYMGGKRMALDEWGESIIPESVINSDKVFYMGERFTYFMFTNGMPDVLQTKGFLDTISKKLPISFIAYDPFSLLASACKHIGNVEYR